MRQQIRLYFFASPVLEEAALRQPPNLGYSFWQSCRGIYRGALVLIKLRLINEKYLRKRTVALWTGGNTIKLHFKNTPAAGFNLRLNMTRLRYVLLGVMELPSWKLDAMISWQNFL